MKWRARKVVVGYTAISDGGELIAKVERDKSGGWLWSAIDQGSMSWRHGWCQFLSEAKTQASNVLKGKS